MKHEPYGGKPSAGGLLASALKDPHAPISAMIEIADRCNEVCVHCYQVQGQKGEIGTDDWRKVMDDLAELGVLFLTISGGEATLRKDFLEIVAYARSKRFAVKIFTNGLTLSRELADRLFELAVQEVQISLYSHRAEVHDWVTRVPGSWDKTVAGVRHAVAAGLRVVLKTPLMSFNADEIDTYMGFVTELGALYTFDPHLDPREDNARDPEAFRVSDEQLRVALANPGLRDSFELHREQPLDQSVCGACSGNVHVEANGEIRPCTQLDVPVGNALREGVIEAWKNDRTGRAIRQLTWGDLHGCRDCDLRHYCYHCFANARTEEGDALGPYATGCHAAIAQYEAMTGPATFEPFGGRDARLGPFAEVAKGVLRGIADQITERDRELARAHGWTLRDANRAAPTPAHPGQLVQIRRPGAGRAREEIVPSAPLAIE